MKRIFRLLVWAPMIGCVLHADWKIVTKTGGGKATEYYKGNLTRSESAAGYSTVMDFEHRRQVNWRTDLRQYAVFEWPPAPAGDSSGTLITIERTTTDTGERKAFFGRPGRRMITKITRSDGGPDTMIDAWYVDVPGLPKSKGGVHGTFAILSVAVAGEKPAPPRIEVKQNGPPTDGLAVWQRTSYTAGGHSNDTVSEVTELVEGNLPDSLFRPPSDYRRVENLPYPTATTHTWGEMLQAHWRMIEEWCNGLFGKR